MEEATTPVSLVFQCPTQLQIYKLYFKTETQSLKIERERFDDENTDIYVREQQ
jgi:hypothetical protein